MFLLDDFLTYLIVSVDEPVFTFSDTFNGRFRPDTRFLVSKFYFIHHRYIIDRSLSSFGRASQGDELVGYLRIFRWIGMQQFYVDDLIFPN